MNKVILIDGNSLMHRAYHASEKVNLTNHSGLHTNMILTFIKMFKKIISIKYSHILVAFDKGKDTFRHKLLDSYKDGRKSLDESFLEQVPYIKRFLDILNIKYLDSKDYEADDIIGCYSCLFKKDYKVLIYTSDKDLLQLIDDNVDICFFKTGLSDIEVYNKEYFLEKYSLRVEQFIDYKALVGDKSDNLKGVNKVGEKTAKELLNKYGSIDNIYNNLDEIKDSLKQSFIKCKDSCYLSRLLATIVTNQTFEYNISDLEKKDINNILLKEYLTELDLDSVFSLFNIKKNVNDITYKLITSFDELKNIIDNENFIYIDTTDPNYHKYDIEVICISNNLGNYIIDKKLLYDNLVINLFNNTKFITYDLKKHACLLKRYGISFLCEFDLSLAIYIFNHKLSNLKTNMLFKHFNISNLLIDESSYITKAYKVLDYHLFRESALRKCYGYFLIKDEIKEELDNKALYDIEHQVSYILADIEQKGFLLDKQEILRQKESLEKELKDIEYNIFNISGESINLSSPKQLSLLLFEKLGIKYPIKSKKYSTDINILEQIKDKHEVVEYIISYRRCKKILSTYIEPFLELIDNNNIIHTIFCQTLTDTGRLSSICPNLQNIPVKDPYSKEVRKCFIPRKDSVLLSCDYSQIELRVLASMANIKNFINCFNSNIDIHTSLAQELFKTKDITYLQRQMAKSINFGILYGMSAYSLSCDLNIPFDQAEEFINKFYKLNSEVLEFVEKNINFCRENGFVTSILNRKRFVDEINSTNYLEKENAKRIIMNTPIQSSSADIIKLAMIRVYNKLKECNLKSYIVLQVHDELILNVFNDELEEVKLIVKKEMEEAIKLNVKLEVSIDTGLNWYLLK